MSKNQERLWQAAIHDGIGVIHYRAVAYTKSEARSKIKRRLGRPIPPGTKVLLCGLAKE